MNVLSSTQLYALLIGLTTVVGATVAVCTGHIDPTTFIALVGPVGGVGVGAGVHAAGVQVPSPAPARPVTVTPGAAA